MQVIQEVFVGEEWVKDTRNKVGVEANLCAEANKALGAFEQKNKELAMKLTAEEKAWKRAEASLKSAQNQAEDKRKRLYHIELELATVKQ